MGIIITLKAKRDIVGKGLMINAPIGKLKKLLSHLRAIYRP